MKYGLMTVVAALVFALASPAGALTQPEAQEMARSVGSDAKVYMVKNGDGEFNGYYTVDMWEGPVIVLIGFEHLSEPAQRFIAWHEIGHSLQYKNGEFGALRARGPYEVEWDADAFAIRQMSYEGVDGALVSEELWAYLYNRYRYKGKVDGPHGLSTGRVTRGNLNRVTVRVEAA